jgi:unconventional prefoldin RPB5 interactor 1
MSAGRRPLTEEQKQRNNDMAKERRLKSKLQKAQHELEDLEANKLPEPEVIQTQEDPDEIQKRKMEIAEKRKKSLELARSKIKSRSQIRNEKDDEISKIKEENERIKAEKDMLLKQKEEELKAVKEEKQKVKKVVRYVPQAAPPPQAAPIKKKKTPEVVQSIPKQEPTLDYLAQQSYAEQLQRKMRETILQRVMNDTFS